MDAVRQIRFAIAPFFLYGSIILGAVISGDLTVDKLKTAGGEVLLAIGGALIASALPIGLLISTLSILALRAAFRPFTRQSYEVVLPQSTWTRIWEQLRTTRQFDVRDTLYAGVTFDHELTSEGIHEWLMRRWTSFNISVNSCTALLLAHFVGWLMQIPQTCQWWAVTSLSLTIFAVAAIAAWRQTMGMLDFQSTRVQPGRSGDRRESAGARPAG